VVFVGGAGIGMDADGVNPIVRFGLVFVVDICLFWWCEIRA